MVRQLGEFVEGLATLVIPEPGRWAEADRLLDREAPMVEGEYGVSEAADGEGSAEASIRIPSRLGIFRCHPQNSGMFVDTQIPLVIYLDPEMPTTIIINMGETE